MKGSSEPPHLSSIGPHTKLSSESQWGSEMLRNLSNPQVLRDGPHSQSLGLQSPAAAAAARGGGAKIG